MMERQTINPLMAQAALLADEDRLHIGIFDRANPKDTQWARRELYGSLRLYMGEQAKWLPPYEDVARWLTDNEGRGLICMGMSGLGKTLICQKCLPVLFQRHFDIELMSVTATDMARRIDELLAFCTKGHIIIIDDLGTEAAVTVNYGNRRKPFCELVDAAVRRGTLLIISTNLLTTRLPSRPKLPSIEERYGVPTLDRLRQTTRVVRFVGESMRR